MKSKITKKILAAGLVVTMMTAVVTGCGFGTNTADTGSGNTGSVSADSADSELETNTDKAGESNELKVVRIATPGVDESGAATMQEGALIAQKQGFMEEALNEIGYTAEYYGFATMGVGVNEALAAEEVDVALYGDFPAITYLAAGNEATIFGVNSSRIQLGVYATDEIQSVADLAGKKIGVTLGTNGFKYLVNLLEENGLSVDDVEIVNASSELASLFATGDIDAIAQSTLLFYSLAGQGAGHVLTVNEDSEELSSYYVALGRKPYLDENPDVAAAILKGLKKAEDYAKENATAVYDTMAEASGYFTADIYAEYYGFDTSFSYWSPYLTDTHIAKIQETADFMYQNQYIPSEVTVADHLDIITAE